jgi:GDPmannose 4,6-dehydratase
LELGNVSIIRDWGWAPEYAFAMYQMLQQSQPDDYVIATGKSISLGEFVKIAFEYFDLDYKKYLKINESFIRPTDISYSKGDSSKAARKLKWEPKYVVDDVIKMMIEAELNNRKSSSK